MLIAGCVEPYEFVVHQDEPGIVVEAFISDKSFNETVMYPSDGRYFTVKLSKTGDVVNHRPEAVTGAKVQLLNDQNEAWVYSEVATGLFQLLDSEFKAIDGKQYKMRIVLADEQVIESEWESLPDVDPPSMGEIVFDETETDTYVMEANEWVVNSLKTVSVNIQVAGNDTGRPVFYRWTYEPMWIYIAPLTSVVDPGHKCWATDASYLNTYALQVDRSGGYKKDLFHFPTIRNDRIFEKFSVLVTQHAMTQGYFEFWQELKDQSEGSILTETTPFSLRTNYFSLTGGKKVYGYFGVVREQAKRWYFSSEDLTYNVTNTLRGDCLVVFGPGPPAPSCLDCREYKFGQATLTQPAWWQK